MPIVDGVRTTRPDHEYGPANVFIGVNFDRNLKAAVSTRALAEGVPDAVIIRRWCRAGATAEGVDVTGLGAFAPAPPGTG